MDPKQNIPPNYRDYKSDNTFALDTSPRQYSNMESLQTGFIICSKVLSLSNKLNFFNNIINLPPYQHPFPQQTNPFSYIHNLSNNHNLNNPNH